VGAVAFWIALGAVIIAGGYFRSRSEAVKHETLRRIVEKTGQVEEAQFKALYQPPPNPWLMPPGRKAAGGGYRALRVFGALLMFVAAGLALFFTIVGQAHAQSWDHVMIGYACTSIVLLVGAGLYFCSRFMPKPSAATGADKPPA
jgi:hypothetical protein